MRGQVCCWTFLLFFIVGHDMLAVFLIPLTEHALARGTVCGARSICHPYSWLRYTHKTRQTLGCGDSVRHPLMDQTVDRSPSSPTPPPLLPSPLLPPPSFLASFLPSKEEGRRKKEGRRKEGGRRKKEGPVPVLVRVCQYHRTSTNVSTRASARACDPTGAIAELLSSCGGDFGCLRPVPHGICV